MEQLKSNREAALLPVNQSEAWGALSDSDKATLAQWIANHISAANKVHRSTSYDLKHVFAKSPGGFYLTNGQFKGAMQAASYAAEDESVINWQYRIKVKTD